MESTQKQKVTMRQMIEKNFVANTSESGKSSFTCRLCGTLLFTITGVSKHWRVTHQHDTKIYIGN